MLSDVSALRCRQFRRAAEIRSRRHDRRRRARRARRCLAAGPLRRSAFRARLFRLVLADHAGGPKGADPMTRRSRARCSTARSRSPMPAHPGNRHLGPWRGAGRTDACGSFRSASNFRSSATPRPNDDARLSLPRRRRCRRSRSRMARFQRHADLVVCDPGLGLIFAIFIQVRVGLAAAASRAARRWRAFATARRARLDGKFPAEIEPLASELNSLIDHSARSRGPRAHPCVQPRAFPEDAAHRACQRGAAQPGRSPMP